jgi:glycosidase
MKTLLWLCMLAASGSCGKHGGPPPFTPPAPPVTVSDTLPPQYGQPFAGVPDADHVIMYEVNVRAFSSSHDLAGVTARLDSIQSLGVNVIWLMPVYPVGKVKAIPPMGSPYSVQDYTAVNPAFGNLDDLRALVAGAHARGMAVILDWVADHTSWDNVWISNTSWYQQDASGHIISPPGQSWNDVAALNYGNNDMRQAMIRAMKYWILAANVDGYRCDYADGPPADFWAQAIDSLNALSPHHKLVLLAETSSPAIFSDGFQLNYAWDYYTALKQVFGDGQSASGLVAASAAEDAALPEGAYKLRFTTNHDEDLNDGPPVDLFGGKQGSVAAFVLASCMGGTPLVYDGQEVGDPQRIPIFDTSSIDWNGNADIKEAYKKILAFRKGSSALSKGSLASYSTSDVAAFVRKSGTEEVLVIVNVRGNTVAYTPAAALAGAWHDAMSAGQTVEVGPSLSLAPYEWKILFKN